MKNVAFYLPQFHQIPENDAWWGTGFTDWVNVRRARSLFDGHIHPRRSLELGEYDLTDPAIARTQSALARRYGIDAFCMYFYWFDGHRLLDRPLEMWREDSGLLPYCLSWANESWTRRWDGKSRDVLMPQGYAPGFEKAIFADLLPHFEAPHYLRREGLPILVVHRADLIPKPRSMADSMRRMAIAAGLPGLHLVAAETKPGLRPESIGFDAVVEFPPVGANTLGTAYLPPLKGLSREFRGRLMSYDRLVKRYVKRAEPEFVRYRSVVPGWDNSARRQGNATVYVGSDPVKYATWLKESRRLEQAVRGEAGLVFVNAWNEWAEGAYLEPDATFGFGYLEATRGDPQPDGQVQLKVPRGKWWSYPQIRSLGLTFAGTVLAIVRRLRNRIR